MKNLILSPSGKTLGYTVECGFKVEIHEANGELKGYYLRYLDKTFGKSGEYKGSGNQLVSLLES